MADPRLHSIYFHAGRLFNRKRYANTKVSEIAAAAGVATGTIYNLFASKKAILTFVIRASLEKDYLEGDLALPVEEADSQLLLSLWSRLHDRVTRACIKRLMWYTGKFAGYMDFQLDRMSVVSWPKKWKKVCFRSTKPLI